MTKHTDEICEKLFRKETAGEASQRCERAGRAQCVPGKICVGGFSLIQ